MNISVVMATYNGAKYIRQQIDSILPFMEENDEMIISDDGSKDDTIEIVKEYAKKDKRVVFFDGPHQGVIKNFENALSRAQKEIVMLSDQDDIWFPEKLPLLRHFFEKNEDVQLVLHDMFFANDGEIDEHSYSKKLFDSYHVRHGFVYNWIYSGYFGCCMAFTQKLKNYLLPFSKYVNMHDQWIGLIGEYYHKSAFIVEPLIAHRVHDNNVSQKRPYLVRFKYRIVSLIAFLDKVFCKRKAFSL